jgi:hypothetical protein
LKYNPFCVLFTERGTRIFLNDFPAGATSALRWRTMRKLAELDALQARIKQMKSILSASFHCQCRQLEDCERFMAAKACSVEVGSAR